MFVWKEKKLKYAMFYYKMLRKKTKTKNRNKNTY